MASSASISHFVLKLLVLISLFNLCCASRKLTSLYQDQTQLLKYHNGPLLTGKISINLIFYGNFKPTQKAIISDFVLSLSKTSPPTAQIQPAVATWWKTVDNYYQLANSRTPSSLSLSLGKEILDEKYSLGKSLTRQQIIQLASKGEQSNAINVVLTAADVKVEGFCMSSCGTHGSSRGAVVKGKIPRFAYIWVGNSETQCPGYCAWPFHQPPYGPQNPPLVAPNNDVGLDGMIINLASLLAATATNPFGNGFYQGPGRHRLRPLQRVPASTQKGLIRAMQGTC